VSHAHQSLRICCKFILVDGRHFVTLVTAVRASVLFILEVLASHFFPPCRISSRRLLLAGVYYAPSNIKELIFFLMICNFTISRILNLLGR
jgi:hypothetical protein